MTFQLSWKFYRRIVEKILLLNSRRQKYSDMLLKGRRLFCNKGWKESYNFFRNSQNTRKNKNALQKDMENQKYPDKTNSITDSFKTELFKKLESFLSNPQKNLIFPIYQYPVVSIIILTFNKSEYTYQCLNSLLEKCDIPFEVIIVDNGSTDTTSRLLNKVDNIVPIFNKQNMGFALGCNEGVKKAKGKYLLFLNNDTVVTKHWLSRLVSTLEKYPDCGAVGGKLVLPNGQLQEAGSIIWNDGSTYGYGRGDDPQKPEYSYVREVDYCSGACLLVRSEEFQKLIGFDIRYIPAYYEDADLCLELQSQGKKIIYQPEVTIFHHEFTSSSMENVKKHMVNNRLKFVEKWGNYLQIKKNPSQSNILNARDIRKGKKILVLDDRIPDPSQESGFPGAHKLLTFLGELGYKVTFFPLDKTTPYQPYIMMLQQLGIEVFYGDNLDFFKFAQQRAGFYNVIIVNRPHNFEKHNNTINSFFPTAFIIFDTEDFFSTREIIKAKIEGIRLNNEETKKFSESKN